MRGHEPRPGQEPDDLRSLVRRKIGSGKLPLRVETTYAGVGTETACTGCGVPTKVTGIQFESVAGDGRLVTMCRPCFFIWSQETSGDRAP